VSAETLLALVAFAFATLWTPGPNNILLANSGATYGFRRTAPHLLGVALGFPFMLFCVAIGLGEAFRAEPALRAALEYVGAAVMLWIAWKVASAGRAKAAAGRGRPWRFHEAVAFQWINPKAWSMAVAISSVYMTGAQVVVEAASIAVLFLMIGLGSASGWAGFGAAIRRWLSNDERLRAFNLSMGALVAASAIYILLDGA
jgi:threonine/homoserine/homoserine lactone efflux protein